MYTNEREEHCINYLIYISKARIETIEKEGDVFLVNRPGVARADLQTPLSLINSISHPFPPNLHNAFSTEP